MTYTEKPVEGRIAGGIGIRLGAYSKTGVYAGRAAACEGTHDAAQRDAECAGLRGAKLRPPAFSRPLAPV